MTAEEEDTHPSKRRRLGQKTSMTKALLLANPTWEEIMQVADEDAFRVGLKIVSEGALLEAIRLKCPDQIVHHLVLCRGMDRMVGPNVRIAEGLAPLRKFACIRRRFEDVIVEDHWEPWEKLSARKMRRKCAPARCGLTIFARSRMCENPGSSSQKRNSSSEVTSFPRPKKALRISEGPSQSLECRPDHAHLETPKEEIAEQRQIIDLISDKHGPKILALPTEERACMLRVHKNMGHPKPTKLKTFCQQMGRPEMIEAIDDLRCSACIESKGPELAKPSSIHTNLEFGDVVSMDGVKWTNQQGHQFFFYHFVDQGTTFHTANTSKSHSSSDAIKALGSAGEVLLEC